MSRFLRYGWAVAAILVAVAVILSGAGLARGRPAGSTLASSSVRLVLPHGTLRAGELVQVGIVNEAANPIIHTGCFILQRRDAGAWRTINGTHGIRVPCTTTASVPSLGAPARLTQALPLYDDLQPGTYRITLLYKFLPKHWKAAKLDGHLQAAEATLTVLRFRPGPAPHVGERRIRRVALQTAAHNGDRHPVLIQHVEAPRFEANLIATPGATWDWSWTYLIAIRLHSGANPPPGPVSSYALRATPAQDSLAAPSVIMIVISARTGQVEDSGSSDHYPDLTSLGPVTTDYQH